MTWNRERGDRARGTTATSHKHIYNNMPQTADQMRMAKVEPSSTPHRTGVAALPTFGALPAMASVGLGRGRVGQIRSCRLRSKLCEGQIPSTHWMLWLCSVAMLVVTMISISSMDHLMNQYDYHIMFYPYISSYELNDRSTARVSQFKSHCRTISTCFPVDAPVHKIRARFLCARMSTTMHIWQQRGGAVQIWNSFMMRDHSTGCVLSYECQNTTQVGARDHPSQ